MITNEDLIQLLLNYKVVTKELLDKAVTMAEKKSISLYSELVESNYISPEHLVKLCTEFLDVPRVDLTDESIDSAVVQLIPEKTARNLRILVYRKEKSKVFVAIADPQDKNVWLELKKHFKNNFETALTTPNDIMRQMLLYKKELKETFAELIRKNTKIATNASLNEAPIIKIIDTIFDYAIVERASDVHIEPSKNEVIVRYRIDGILYEVVRLEKELLPALIARLKIMSNLRIDESRIPQDGRFFIQLEGQKVSCRISTMLSMHGEKASIRILPESARVTTLEDLGLTGISLERVRDAITKTSGIMLATGPTGSGKTSTLYSALRTLDVVHLNISTLEDPVEYEIPLVNQFQVNREIGLDFATGLRSLLRQDPNVIMVGEIRDKETAQMAMNASLTGHFVLSTLHTLRASTVLPRLLDMGVEPYIVASSISAIIAQRLVRTNCMNCLASYELPESVLESLESIVGKSVVSKLPKQLYHGKGCRACNGLGYSGRIGIFEVLTVTDSIRKMIDKRASVDDVEDLAKKEGMQTMVEDGLEKVVKGVTTIEEILRVLRD